MFAIVLAAVVTAIISWLIGYFTYTPRPFVEGIGNILVAHKDNASLPSNHMMFISIFAAMFLLSGKRKIGLFFSCLTVGIGWSRIYLGLHYPVDIIGGALIGAIVSMLVWKGLRPIYRS